MLEKFIEMTGYALADAVNPCAIAVLTMVLISILVNNPEKRNEVLKTGLLFAFAVFIGYFVYAGILTQFFKTFAEFFAENSMNVKTIFGVLALLLGALNIKDYFYYQKGQLLTEMPLFMRPKLRKITKNITSPKGAFFLGFVITLFLLPCTAGPLVLAAAAVAGMSYISIFLWFLYYNFIFILPMIGITLTVYFGFKEVEDVSSWKERNIRKLHLFAGIILFLIGLGLLNDWL